MKKISTILSLTLILRVPAGSIWAAQEDATDSPEADPYAQYQASKDAALAYLSARQSDAAEALYVYSDFSSALNYFTQKAKIDDGNSDYIYDMNENWQEDPFMGDSAIEVRAKTVGTSWGGWLFLNGYLPEGSTEAQLDFGDVPDAGLDLSGATALTFWAKGAEGGEVVEFFTAGLGYDGETNAKKMPYPDSSTKITLGFTTLTNEWEPYSIDLSGVDLTHIGSGFGFVLSGVYSGDRETTFYLDEIRFEGPIAMLQDAPRFIKSYETDTRNDPDDLYIQNTAFSYDNALAALAFISDGKQEQAKALLDAFVYAVANDRYQPIVCATPICMRYPVFPGLESGTRLPGWYDVEAKTYYEDQYQVGTNVGNSSFVALALLQYYKEYGGEEYLQLAETAMDWVLDNCTEETPGFTAGYDGWPEAEDGMQLWTYKSTEHTSTLTRYLSSSTH